MNPANREYPFDYRRGTRKDVPTLALINRQLIEDEGGPEKPPIDLLQQRLRKLLNQGFTPALFLLDGRIAAYALYRVDDRQVYIRQFFVARDRRRQGIGRRAFQYLKREIWPRGRRVWVEALVANPTAVAFWKAMGFNEYSLALDLNPGGYPD